LHHQKIPAPATTAIQISSSLALKLDAPEVTQQTPRAVTPDEKTASEDAPVKSEAPSAPEVEQEPAGANISMNVSPAITGESGAVSPIPLNASSEDVSLTKIYRVGPGDVLDVRINEAQPQQSTLFTVTPAGLLEHPLLAEPLSVSALTTEEIQTRIQDDLKTRALIENPAVTVGVRDYASHAILVSGLVKDSGTKFLRREAIPLYVVVADAQPLPEAAKVTVVRNGLNQVFEIDLTNVAQMNLLVRSGDVINLHPNETQFVYVGGEVKAPGEKIFRPGLTLMQAIISASGMTSKSKVAEIGRDGGRGFLVKTSFKLKDIQTGKARDPLIKAGDRIMILR
jgi:protein involved in polysaccharide export with SLBB domain